MRTREKQKKPTETYCRAASTKVKGERLRSFSAAVREDQPEANNPVLLCHRLTEELVNQCLGDCLDNVSEDLLNDITCQLRQCLLEELEGCDVPDKSSGFSIPAIVTAASRELHRTMGPKEAIETALLLQRNKDYRIITKTLKKHLLVQRGIVAVLLNNLLSVGRAGLLCCFILPEEDNEDIIVCRANNDSKVLDKQPLLPARA